MECLLVSKVKRWTRFTITKIKNDKELKECKRSINVDDEYQEVLRSKSFIDVFSKAQLLVEDRSSSMAQSYLHHRVLLEPNQETIATILESRTISKNYNMKVLIRDYFDVSSEASKICIEILKSIIQVRSNYASIQQILNIVLQDCPHQSNVGNDSNISNLITHNNPFFNISNKDFEVISEKYSSALHKMKIRRRKVDRKIKLISYFNKALGICLTAVGGFLAVTAMALAAHTLTALVIGPMIFSLPLKSLKKKLGGLQFLQSRRLRRAADQLDVAMKGAYILNRGFDTIIRLVNDLNDEINRNRKMIELCLERGRREDKICLQIFREVEKSHVWFRKQVDELEEHVYMCLLSINKAKALAIKELSKSCEEKAIQNSEVRNEIMSIKEIMD